MGPIRSGRSLKKQPGGAKTSAMAHSEGSPSSSKIPDNVYCIDFDPIIIWDTDLAVDPASYGTQT